MDINILPAALTDKPSIAKMLKGPYLRELAQYFAPHEPAAEQYDYPYLDAYWEEPGARFPFLITANGELAGFAFVNQYSRLGTGNAWSMAEFYIEPSARGHGVGKTAAELVLRQFPGNWEVAVLTGNEPALAFWRRVATRVANDDVMERTTERWNGVIYTFSVKG